MKSARQVFLEADLEGLELEINEILHYYRIYNGVAELSTGEEDGNVIYGVAVVQDSKLIEAKVFYDIDIAKNYIFDLKTPKKTR